MMSVKVVFLSIYAIPSVLGSAELRSIIMITLHNTLTKSVDIDLFITAQNYRQFHAKGGSSLFITQYLNLSSLGFMILPLDRA